MPISRIPDARTPAYFIQQAIKSPPVEWALNWSTADYGIAVAASAELEDIYGDRVIPDTAVKGAEQVFPYIRFKIEDIPDEHIAFEAGSRAFIAKTVVKATVVTCHVYPQGLGTYEFSEPGRKNLMACLLGIYPGTQIKIDDEVIGDISQSRWIQNKSSTRIDKDTGETVVEVGIELQIVYN